MRAPGGITFHLQIPRAIAELMAREQLSVVREVVGKLLVVGVHAEVVGKPCEAPLDVSSADVPSCRFP